MNEPGRLPPVASPVPLDARAVRRTRVLLLVALAAPLVLLYLLSEGFRAEVNRALGVLGRGDIAGLRDYILSFGVLAPAASCFLIVLQALAAPVPSFVITFANGLAFGLFWGWLLSVFGHALAATVCFWISRSLGRVPVEALVGRAGLQSADRWFARWGAYAIFAARLFPGIAFDAVSYAAGLTSMQFRKFLAATTLGIAPQTLVYSYLGDRAPGYIWPLLVVSALVVVGAMVAVLRRRTPAEPRRRVS